MISFLPIENPGFIRMQAYDGESETGFCDFYVDKYVMYITALECSDGIITEGLLRSAMNYAANRNAYIAEARSELSSPVFIRLGFKGEASLKVEIPQALTTGCSCGHEKTGGLKND